MHSKDGRSPADRPRPGADPGALERAAAVVHATWRADVARAVALVVAG